MENLSPARRLRVLLREFYILWVETALRPSLRSSFFCKIRLLSVVVKCSTQKYSVPASPKTSDSTGHACFLPPASCLLPTASCLLPTASCLLPTAYCPSSLPASRGTTNTYPI